MSRKQQRQTEVAGVLEDPSQDTEQLAWTNASVVRVFPRYYIYVRDLTTNVTRLEVGPQTFVRKDNEQVIAQPLKMVRQLKSRTLFFSFSISTEPGTTGQYFFITSLTTVHIFVGKIKSNSNA